ncbi:ornithine carbamoyltransferase [Cohnella herbarum]|uniref:Ornithine carbamoyltransferase n=2 Tax=Cohnella herbarum TaxID=2728023 RepID=A0A7Z2VRJ9_9BACL|nr:ornithine carbamoyltransferase [Cohnella herbarum]
MHFLNIDQLSEQQILGIFDAADQLKRNRNSSILSSRTFVLFFPESSIRTRLTFEKGIKDLGGDSILFPPETLDKRESLEDVMQYIQNWGDGVIVRHADFNKMKELAEQATIPVINAMSSVNHPCEIISDLYRISRMRSDYRKLVYTFVGPAGNICNSWRHIAQAMDLNFNHACVEGERLSLDNLNYRFHTELEAVLENSDIVLTDSLPAPFRTRAYIDRYQITLDRMKLANEGALLNPCPPFFRNEEVSDDAINSDYFAGHAFKRDLIHVQQAILLACLGINNPSGD